MYSTVVPSAKYRESHKAVPLPPHSYAEGLDLLDSLQDNVSLPRHPPPLSLPVVELCGGTQVPSLLLEILTTFISIYANWKPVFWIRIHRIGNFSGSGSVPPIVDPSIIKRKY